MIRFSLAQFALGSALLLSLLGCQEDGELRHEEPRHGISELRPTDPQDPGGYEGAAAESFLSPQGYLRVWYALEGPHRPPQEDQNQSGIPDYVELAAAIGDEVGALITSQGWRRPLVGSSLSNSEPLDLFLVDFSAGDGNFRPEFCGRPDSTQATRCAGHLRVENDFQPLFYPSLEYALRVVVSHEYFHAVQYAYTAELPAWWAEGTATWFQEYYWSEQEDFERLTSNYFADHTRSLNDRQRGPFDGFAYGAGLFAYFLEVFFDPEIHLEIFEVLAEEKTTEEAIEKVLQSRGSSLRDAFQTFALFNAFTGRRAQSDQGYREAQRFEEVELLALDGDRALNWNFEVDPLASTYGFLEASRNLSLFLEPIEGRDQASLQVITFEDFANGSPALSVSYDEALVLQVSQLPAILVAANGDLLRSQAAQVQIRAQSQPREPADPVDEEEEETRRGCQSTSGPPSLALLALFFLFLLFRTSKSFPARF